MEIFTHFQPSPAGAGMKRRRNSVEDIYEYKPPRNYQEQILIDYIHKIEQGPKHPKQPRIRSRRAKPQRTSIVNSVLKSFLLTLLILLLLHTGFYFAELLYHDYCAKDFLSSVFSHTNPVCAHLRKASSLASEKFANTFFAFISSTAILLFNSRKP